MKLSKCHLNKSKKFPQKGIYIIRFENDDENVYKIGSTSDLKKRIKNFKTCHVGKIDIVKFYDVENNILKVEEILHWRLRKNRIIFNQEFFKIENLKEIDNIIDEISSIISDGLYPKSNSTEEQLRLFVIKILGGEKEDVGHEQTDSHKRFDYGVTWHSDKCRIEHNQKIVSILQDWKLLFKASSFDLKAWKGSVFWWFTLKFHYKLNLNNDFSAYLEPYSKHTTHFSQAFNEKENIVNSETGKIFDYRGESGGLGTISVIIQIIKTITLSEYYMK